MFETVVGFVAPLLKDFLWAAAAMLLTYTLNKIQSHFNTI
jgi:hypothetical protein